tara:strand:- start:135 stop:443 length:309 start_codon:yes stop_codon:yes gene_type:complete
MYKPKNTYLANCEVEYPESSSRLLAILFILKPVALLPHYIVLYFLNIIALLMALVGYILVIITGKYPRGLFALQVGVIRWNLRVNCWLIGLTDKYPPFTFNR